MVKILFVDIDGPLVTMDKPEVTKFGTHSSFNMKAVEALNDIWRHTSCELVISSDWTINNLPSLYKMRQFFAMYGILAPIIGFTRKRAATAQTLEKVRCQEIEEWVETHNPRRYAAIDDMTLTWLGDNFFLTDPIDGLGEPGLADKIITHLNS